MTTRRDDDLERRDTGRHEPDDDATTEGAAVAGGVTGGVIGGAAAGAAMGMPGGPLGVAAGAVAGAAAGAAVERGLEAGQDHDGLDRRGSGWDEMKPRFRDRWQSRYGTAGGRWEDYEPGYRYGFEMANDPRYRGRDWTSSESDLRTGYGEWSNQRGYRHEGNAWDRFKDSVRDAWESVTSGSRD